MGTTGPARTATPAWRLGALALLAALVSPAAVAALGPGDAPAAPVTVQVDDGLITVHARDAPLADVITAIGHRAGFRVVQMGPVSGRVTADFVRVRVPDALDRLLSGTGHVILHDPGGRNTDVAGGIDQVWLLGTHAGPDGETDERMEAAVAAAGQEDDGKARSEALLGLVRHGATDEVLATLEDALHDDEAPLVRTRAAMALGALGDVRSLPALESALRDDHPTVRVQVILALAQIDDPRATRLLGELLLSGASTRERVVAAWGLWRHDSDRARTYLAASANDPDPQVRKAVSGPPQIPRASGSSAAASDR